MIELSRSYLTDYHDAWQSPSAQYVHNDFCNRLSYFLHDQYVMKPHCAMAIADSLFARMCDMDLYYHTPIHILSIFSWAEAHKIEITPPVELSIWFHDAIYDPRAIKYENEDRSSQFMKALVGKYVSPKELSKANFMIEMTGDHFNEINLSDEVNLLLDLDMCNFSWDHKNYTASSVAIELEYAFHGFEQVRLGRRKFLHQLMEKKHIYRTPAIRDKYEARARANIQRSISRLNDEIGHANF